MSSTPMPLVPLHDADEEVSIICVMIRERISRHNTKNIEYYGMAKSLFLPKLTYCFVLISGFLSVKEQFWCKNRRFRRFSRKCQIMPKIRFLAPKAAPLIFAE